MLTEKRMQEIALLVLRDFMSKMGDRVSPDFISRKAGIPMDEATEFHKQITTTIAPIAVIVQGKSPS